MKELAVNILWYLLFGYNWFSALCNAVTLPSAPSGSYVVSQLFIKSNIPDVCMVQGLQDIQIPSPVINQDGSITGSTNSSFIVNCTKQSGNLGLYQITVGCQNNGFILTNISATGTQVLYQMRFSASADASNGDLLVHNQTSNKSFTSGPIGNMTNNASLYIQLTGVNGGLNSGIYQDVCSLTISYT